jgi:hypothetical protein
VVVVALVAVVLAVVVTVVVVVAGAVTLAVVELVVEAEVVDAVREPRFDDGLKIICYSNETSPWPESPSKLYRTSDRRLSAKLVQTSADRGCHVVSVTDPYGRILGIRDQKRYFFFKVAPQL